VYNRFLVGVCHGTPPFGWQPKAAARRQQTRARRYLGADASPFSPSPTLCRPETPARSPFIG
jgi:hypothetical protein